ncbi:MAG: hypothetical protein IJ228_11430 [Succinivibrio sp.]|nr:hypothetical protein [Succinivibrio sp.]
MIGRQYLNTLKALHATAIAAGLLLSPAVMSDSIRVGGEGYLRVQPYQGTLSAPQAEQAAQQTKGETPEQAEQPQGSASPTVQVPGAVFYEDESVRRISVGGGYYPSFELNGSDNGYRPAYRCGPHSRGCDDFFNDPIINGDFKVPHRLRDNAR